MKEKYLLLNKKVNNLLNNEYILEIYLFIMASIAVLGWTFNDILGLTILVSVGAIALILTNDMKYAVPAFLYFPFMINSGFSAGVVPIPLIIVASILFIVVIIYACINKLNFKNMRQAPVLFAMAINMFVPIFWFKESNEVMYYFLYFAGFGYLIVYILFAGTLKKNSIEVVAKTFTYLAVILFCECAIRINQVRTEDASLLSLSYYLGWGVCNEAGIMICFSLPFIFYQLSNKTKHSMVLINSFKLAFAVLGIIITTSRGSYIFGSLICFFSYLYLAIKNKKFVFNNVVSLSITLVSVGLFSLILFLVSHEGLIEQVWNRVFTSGLHSSGRIELYNSALQIINESFLNKLFGSGIVSEISEIVTSAGVQNGEIIYHSTLFETLVIGGFIGFAILLIHFYQKYKTSLRLNSKLGMLLLIGLGFVDIYGMIDNTYYMYYYMFPLMILLASIDSSVVLNKTQIKYLF